MTSKLSSQHSLDKISAHVSVEVPIETISYAIGECALGQVLVARSAKGVCAILFGAGGDELEQELAARFPNTTRVANQALLQDDLTMVTRFLDKPAEGLPLALDMRGTAFQQRVWEKLGTIPAGRTVTYTELARWIGPLTSARAVAGACAANPIALAVPCHRVVGSHGALTGYRWGLERKRELLRRESVA